jgi:hypothetical protein
MAPASHLCATLSSLSQRSGVSACPASHTQSLAYSSNSLAAAPVARESAEVRDLPHKPANAVTAKLIPWDGKLGVSYTYGNNDREMRALRPEGSLVAGHSGRFSEVFNFDQTRLPTIRYGGSLRRETGGVSMLTSAEC